MKPQIFRLDSLYSRSGKPFDDSELNAVLSGLPALSSSGPWLAGGALRRLMTDAPMESDFDFFFRDSAQLAAFASDLEGLGFVRVAQTDHHEHYRGMLVGKPRDVQLIKFKYYENAEQVIDSFDFTVCQFAFDGEFLTCGDLSLFDAARKRLVIHTLTYPVSTMRRLLKYQKQGYFACAGCLTEILARTVATPELHTQLDVEYVD